MSSNDDNLLLALLGFACIAAVGLGAVLTFGMAYDVIMQKQPIQPQR